MVEESDWTCDYCGWEFWKPGQGPKPDGWLCLACRWGRTQHDMVDKLLEQVWAD